MQTLTVLAATLVAAMAGSPIQDAGRPDQPASASTSPAVVSEVARVNGTSIRSDRLEAAVNRLIPLTSYHRSVDAKTLAELRQRALDTLIDDELAFQESVRQHVDVSDAALDAAWREAAESYGGTTGLDVALERSGMSATQAREELRRVLMIRSTQAQFVTARCSVSRDDAAAFFAANPNRFLEPEQLHVFGITVGVDPSRPGDWAPARARAEQARRDLDAGAAFEDVARRYSTDASSRDRGGDLGFVHRGSLSEALEPVAERLAPGETSGVVETLYGYHIIRITEIHPPRRATFEAVADKLQQELTEQRCRDVQQTWIASLRASADIVVFAP